MLDSAKSDYFAGQFSLAISGFEALLRTFPRSESAAEAQFYIGETYYQQNKWREAIDAYGLVLQNHRTSGTVPDAYFKRGRAYAQTGQTDAARAIPGKWSSRRIPTATRRAWPSRISSASTARLRRSRPADATAAPRRVTWAVTVVHAIAVRHTGSTIRMHRLSNAVHRC